MNAKIKIFQFLCASPKIVGDGNTETSICQGLQEKTKDGHDVPMAALPSLISRWGI
jgi:hypothetical protein